MSNKVSFILGIAIGMLVMFLFNFNHKTAEEKEMEMTLEMLEQIKNQKPSMQYAEIKGKNGLVTIHTEISKDSAKILLGKPTKTEMRTILNTIHETWTYDINKDGVSDLHLEFENGILDNFTEN